MGKEALASALGLMARETIRLTVSGQGDGTVGRFGGAPDVPPGFTWPYFTTGTFGGSQVKPRPLSFLAQFDCAALAKLSPKSPLPQEGVLSFFYELGSQRWGFDPKDAGCARVYWFSEKLSSASFPADLEPCYRLPPLAIHGTREAAYPDYEDFCHVHADLTPYREKGQEPWDTFSEVRNTLQGGGGDSVPGHKLLGWPDIIQGSMTAECELISRNFSSGGGPDAIPERDLREASETSPDDWPLLFQLSSFRSGDFSLDFGDCGSVYFYLPREDLAARRFDRAWLILQCY